MARPLTLAFDPHAGTEAILYLAAAVDDPTLHAVLKLRYEADKLHLSRYGHFASSDRYVAMRDGPVASGTYNLMRAARGDDSPHIPEHFRAIAREAFEIAEDSVTIVPRRTARLDAIADSDRACLDEVIRCYGHLDFEQRNALTHGQAWKLAWESRGEAFQAAMPIPSIARELDNADEVLEHLSTD